LRSFWPHQFYERRHCPDFQFFHRRSEEFEDFTVFLASSRQIYSVSIPFSNFPFPTRLPTSLSYFTDQQILPRCMPLIRFPLSYRTLLSLQNLSPSPMRLSPNPPQPRFDNPFFSLPVCEYQFFFHLFFLDPHDFESFPALIQVFARPNRMFFLFLWSNFSFGQHPS